MDSRQKLLYIKCKKIKEEEEEKLNEVKDENFKHSTYIALNCFYMGQSDCCGLIIFLYNEW